MGHGSSDSARCAHFLQVGHDDRVRALAFVELDKAPMLISASASSLLLW
eukprot:SAG11_NODE_30594_length_299_cov_1.295000_2_plen_48_part_01